jgi:glycerate 2-kinase
VTVGEQSDHPQIWRILRHVVQQLDPRELVANSVSLNNSGGLVVEGISSQIECPGKLVVIAVGKASIPMATGALDSLADRVSRAVAVSKAGIPSPVDPPAQLEVIEADHPVPTENSLIAGRRVRELAEGLTSDDVVLMLISGGGSALLEDLVDGVTIEDLRGATDHLLRAGATINELNAVRRKISQLKGGRLARAIAPACIVNLIVSDVLNSPLQDIASGPTVQPPEIDETFVAVMNRPDLVEGLPESVQHQLRKQQAHREPWTNNVVGTRILADAETAARAAVDAALELGYYVQTLGFDFQGEAREFGRTWSTIARHVYQDGHAFPLPLALIGSGELTVTVRGDGAGGRNTEMALAAAIDLAGTAGITVCSFATDGDDGVGNCAGGVVDGQTLSSLDRATIDAFQRLANNDSATALRAVDAVIDIGPTGTNVNDLYLALIERQSQ